MLARTEEDLKRGTKSNDATTGPTLAQMGLTKDESSRYQQLAAMPADYRGNFVFWYPKWYPPHKPRRTGK